MTTKEREYDLEDVYDREIAPLMTRIIAVCQEHKMPMVATFQYARSADGVDKCTTALVPPEWAPSKELVAAKSIIMNGLVALIGRMPGAARRDQS